MEGKWKRKTSASLRWPLSKSLQLSELSSFDVMYEILWRFEHEGKFSISQKPFALCHLKLVKDLASHLFHFYSFIWWFGTPTQTISHSLWLQGAGCMESRPQGPSLVREKEKERRDLISTSLWSGVIFFPPHYSVLACQNSFGEKKERKWKEQNILRCLNS